MRGLPSLPVREESVLELGRLASEEPFFTCFYFTFYLLFGGSNKSTDGSSSYLKLVYIVPEPRFAPCTTELMTEVLTARKTKATRAPIASLAWPHGITRCPLTVASIGLHTHLRAQYELQNVCLWSPSCMIGASSISSLQLSHMKEHSSPFSIFT